MIGICVIAVFFPSLYSGPLWDDDVFVFNNPQITSLSNPFVLFNPLSQNHRAWPVGYLFFWGLFRIFGYQWALYKILAIFLHLLNGYLVLRLCRNFKVQHAYIVAAFFIFHPFQIETVSWIFQINTILAASFSLSTILLWLKFEKENKAKPLLAAYLVFALSCFTKPYAAFLPFLLFYISKLNMFKKVAVCAPLFLISLLVAFSSYRGINSSQIESSYREKFHLQNSKQSASPVENAQENKSTELPVKPETMEKSEKRERFPYLSSLSEVNIVDFVSDKVLLISKTFTFYLKDFFIPTHRLLFHPPLYTDLRSSIAAIVFASIFLIGGYCLISFKLLPQTHFWFVFLLVGFLPVSGLFYIPFMKHSQVSDHWAYLLTIPLSVFTVFILQAIGKFVARFSTLKSFATIYSIPFFILIYISIGHSRIFNDHKLMFQINIEANPSSVFLYRYLAKIYEKEGQYKEALYVLNRGYLKIPHDLGLLEQRDRLIRLLDKSGL